MLRFKHFIKLNEGGNVKIGDVSAEPINMTKDNRGQVTSDIHGFLHHLNKSFHKEHGNHLFGNGDSALHDRSAFSGSTNHLFDKSISDEEFKHHKPSVGDIDVKVPKEHMDNLHSHLTPGRKFGSYSVVGVKKGGGEHHALIKHDNGQVHQIDFEGTHYDGDKPSKFDQFSHSSNWEDVKSKIKGVHHKVLLNAIGTTSHKFSILHGLGSRETKDANWEKDPKKISSTLFSDKAPIENLHSFHGLVQNIKNHTPKEKHQEIYNKFKDSSKTQKNIDFKPALKHMRDHLNVKDSVTESVESTETHHTSVIPMTGFVPISHEGHNLDLGHTLKKLPGTHHIGISGKSEAYSPEERKDILGRQWGSGVSAHNVTGAGETIRKGFDSLPKTGKKVLHLLVGHDRKSFAEGLKKSLEAGKLKEMGEHKFDEIHIHHPEDTDRSHGMSGTKMREAANSGDLETFHKHLGSNFSKDEAKYHMDRFKQGIAGGSIPLKRK